MAYKAAIRFPDAKLATLTGLFKKADWWSHLSMRSWYLPAKKFLNTYDFKFKK